MHPLQNSTINAKKTDAGHADVVSIDAARIRRLVAELPKRHRLVITWRFGLDGLTLTRHEIAARLRIEPSVVCRAEREALRLLRDRFLMTQTEREAA